MSRFVCDRKTKAFCSNCGAPVYGNIDPKMDIICAHCAQGLLARIEQYEKLLRTEFKSTEDYRDKMSQYMAKKETQIVAKDMEEAKPIKVFSKGERLRKARKKAGLSQKELASILDIGQATVAHYEKGLRRLPGEVFKFVAKVEYTPKSELIKVSDWRIFLNFPGENITENGEFNKKA